MQDPKDKPIDNVCIFISSWKEVNLVRELFPFVKKIKVFSETLEDKILKELVCFDKKIVVSFPKEGETVISYSPEVKKISKKFAAHPVQIRDEISTIKLVFEVLKS